MKKFEFGLETVHKVREIRKDRQRDALAMVRNQLDEAARLAAEIESRRDEVSERYRSQISAGDSLDLGMIELGAHHLATLTQKKNEAVDHVSQKEVELQAQLERLTEALREVQVTERLRDSREQDYALELSRHEQNNLDELATTEYARRATGVK